MDVKDTEISEAPPEPDQAHEGVSNPPNTSTSEIDIGSLLAEARGNIGLTSHNIAEALNLNPEIIEKIENNIFKQDLPIAFIRGYVKSYATKVGLEVAPLLIAFDKATGVESPSLKSVQSIASFDSKSREFNSNSSAFKLISALVVLVFLTFLGWKGWTDYLEPTFFGELSFQRDGSNTIELQLGDNLPNGQLPTSNEVPASDQESIEDNRLPETEQALAENQESVLVHDQPTKVLEEQLDSSNGALTVTELTSIDMAFTADCWVKVTDARGEVLALGVKQNGKVMALEGVEPIEVILGDASAVSINFGGQLVDLSEYKAGRRVELLLEN